MECREAGDDSGAAPSYRARRETARVAQPAGVFAVAPRRSLKENDNRTRCGVGGLDMTRQDDGSATVMYFSEDIFRGDEMSSVVLKGFAVLRLKARTHLYFSFQKHHKRHRRTSKR